MLNLFFVAQRRHSTKIADLQSCGVSHCELVDCHTNQSMHGTSISLQYPFYDNTELKTTVRAQWCYI